jgi:hypothetical protein
VIFREWLASLLVFSVDKIVDVTIVPSGHSKPIRYAALDQASLTPAPIIAPTGSEQAPRLATSDTNP